MYCACADPPLIRRRPYRSQSRDPELNGSGLSYSEQLLTGDSCSSSAREFRRDCSTSSLKGTPRAPSIRSSSVVQTEPNLVSKWRLTFLFASRSTCRYGGGGGPWRLGGLHSCRLAAQHLYHHGLFLLCPLSVSPTSLSATSSSLSLSLSLSFSCLSPTSSLTLSLFPLF